MAENVMMGKWMRQEIDHLITGINMFYFWLWNVMCAYLVEPTMLAFPTRVWKTRTHLIS